MTATDRGTNRSGPRKRRSALRVGLYYLIFGAAWILVTDTLLPTLVEDTGQWQTYKGLVFVLASAGIIYLLVRRELSARRRAEGELQVSERRYRVMFEESVAGVFRSAMDGEILDANRAMAELLGFDKPEELIGADARSYYSDPKQREGWIAELRSESEIRNYELHLRRRDETSVWTLMNASLMESEEGAVPVLAGTMVDITEEKQLRDELEAYAYHDVLTGLPNRRYLQEKSNAVLSKARRDRSAVGFLYIDLDRFKRVNDTLGHEVGDEVLFHVGRRLQRHLREEDMAARIGGDELAVVLNTIDDREGAVRAAERLHEALDEPFYAGGHSIYVSPSFGVALYPEHGTTFSELLSNADQAMYQALEVKMGGVQVYEPTAKAVRRHEIAEESDLRAALREGQLELHYQPVRRIGHEGIVGAEALARWRHPEIGLRRPGSFIPIAEHSGLIRDIDLWAFATVLEELPDLTSDSSIEWLAVNVSALSLNHDETLGRLHEGLERSGFEPGSLIVEITESTAMQDPRTSIQIFQGLQERGARVAIDDFGTGHSALAYLKSLPVDLVKLDMIFVRGIEASEREDRLLKALIELGKTLEVEVVAEGVETEGQYERVAAHGCHLAQGNYLGRPISLKKLRSRL